ncbi:radical SAM family heme chaperone HemW [Ilyomonas limi]|uniref:Heme chaperone HemW n=1 Tax=Ilyomonas limi TaxID=2575867 RepID=A0A4U3KX31_9BACT|nr:radical SAM family heme chaperone HemW [Ilyomonas limi]TKK65706.1 radical SAM family heme chaperone HemW [Ilyomonas limi]
MAGIYLHIPFCKKACHYCNFHFSASTRYINEMAQAIGTEAALRRRYLDEPVATIYFGGGTPSLLSVTSLQMLLQKLRDNFTITNDAEITLEANPDDINVERLHSWKMLGINRLSIGIQSFNDADLSWMNRAHNAYQALQSIVLAQRAGFSNITIDLIYGTPTLTNEQWRRNVQQAIDLNIPHLSCYALTVEPNTALHKMIENKKMPDVDEEKQSQHFELLVRWLKDAGYEHYEISNFAKPGCESRHNSSYWQGKPYLGLGPSAHSFNGTSRQWNVANNALYMQSISRSTVPFEIEHLTPMQQLNEYIMTSLRTRQGISLNHVSAQWSEVDSMALIKGAKRYIMQGNVVFVNNHLQLTRSGKLLADGIAAGLFR